MTLSLRARIIWPHGVVNKSWRVQVRLQFMHNSTPRATFPLEDGRNNERHASEVLLCSDKRIAYANLSLLSAGSSFNWPQFPLIGEGGGASASYFWTFSQKPYTIRSHG